MPFTADKPIRVGVIGASGAGWGRLAHLPALATIPGMTATAVGTTRMETARAAAEEFGVPLAFDHPDELIGSDQVDLVIVAVRVEHHRDLLGRVLRSGKPVYSEWPSGRNLAETRELRDAFAAAGQYAVPGLQARSTPTVRYLRDLIQDGAIGRPLSTTLLGQGTPWGDVVDERNIYVQDDSLGGTMLTIPFGHTLDGLCSVLGQITSIAAKTAVQRETVRVAGTDRTIRKTTPDQLLLSAELEGGVMFSAHYRGGSPGATALRWEINGTEGAILVTAPNGNLQLSGLTVHGQLRGEDAPHAITVPASYVRADATLSVPAASVAETLLLVEEDLRTGTRRAPTFDDAVRRKESFDALRRAADTGITQQLT